MTSAVQRVQRKAMRIGRRIAGSPVLYLIHPISEWTLPTGVTFNSRFDAFVNASNVPVTVDWRTASEMTAVEFNIGRTNNVATIDPAGLTTFVRVQNVYIEYTDAIWALVTQAWGVSVADKLYRCEGFDTWPFGDADPTRIRLPLIQDTKTA